MRFKAHENGFSLIELAIAMLVIGLFMVPLMEQYKAYRESKAIEDSGASNILISSALGDYYLATYVQPKSGYPCPADATLPPTDPKYGVGQCPAAAAPAVGSCLNGICRAKGNTLAYDPTVGANLAINSNVLIGAVPFVDLKLPADVAVDGWGRKITYAVTESMAKDNNIGQTFNRYRGAIMVSTFDRAKYAAGTVSIIPTAAASDTDRGHQNEHVVIFSHGPDGTGAYNVQGSLFAPCPNVGADRENCNNDAVFFDPALSDPTVDIHHPLPAGGGGKVAGAFHYDDIISEVSDIPTGIWNRSIGANLITQQRIGIAVSDVSAKLLADGTAVTIPQVDSSGNTIQVEVPPDTNILLDVGGNIAVSGAANTTSICDLTGDNCFKPSAIGGSGQIDCSNQSSNTMKGIASSKAGCGLTFPPSVPPISCAPKHYVNAIINGVPKCN